MADINQEISASRQSYNRINSSDDLSLEQARQQLKEENEKKLNEIRKKNIKEEAKLRNKLAEQGIKEGSARYKKELEKLNKQQALEDKKRRDQEYIEQLNSIRSLAKAEQEARTEVNNAIMRSAETSLKEKAKAFGNELKNAVTGENLGANLGKTISKALDNLMSGLNQVMDKYISYQASVNARLQGSGRTYGSAESLLTSAVGIQPYVRNQALVENLANLVDSGIAYNLELRAFVETVSENIATTFDATNGTLLRLVRLQQADSTAARLGLEASLTKYFNGMYQNTEYLSNAFDAVSGALVEASSTMSRDQSVAFEYQVQKWLGSLYSVGMSDTTISGIAQALGYLGSGNVRGLSNSQYQNLLVMSASRAGLNYSDLLTGGLTGEATNVLLASMANYLKEIAQGTNQVVKSELAQTFGVGISDLTAALNLNTTAIRNISSSSMSYNSAMAELSNQLAIMPSRMPIGTMLGNLWDNLEWNIGSNIAQNPVLYSLYKVTDFIKSATGGMGINIPSIGIFGNFLDFNTSIENLVQLGVIGLSSLGMIGDLIGGLASTISPSSMLDRISAGSALKNIVGLGGRGLASSSSGATTSSTVYIGQSSGSDIAQAAKQTAADTARADAQEDEDNTMKILKEDVHSIYEILSKWDTFGVKTEVNNYGLYSGV